MLSVATKKLSNYNFSLPEPIAKAFREIGDARGERNKERWVIASAAVLRLLELSEAERTELFKQLAGAKFEPAGMEKLVAAAREIAAAKESTPPPARKILADVEIREEGERKPSRRGRRG